MESRYGLGRLRLSSAPLAWFAVAATLCLAADGSARGMPPNYPSEWRGIRRPRLNRHANSQPRVSGSPEYTIHVFNQTLDHFNALTNGSGTFSQRYLVTDKYYKHGGPVFVFTGAEGGDVTALYDYAYGHPVAVARKLGALIIFLECRFFGDSLPGKADAHIDDPTAGHLGLLSVEQILADYATIIGFLRSVYSLWNSPVLTFGGSLAGTLAALMRVRHPELVDMAWASSTPLKGYPNIAGINQYTWREQVTKNFELLAPGCPVIVRRGFEALMKADPSTVHQVFRVCGPSSSSLVDDITQMGWAVLEGDGEFVYPLKTSPIPAHCAAMAKAANSHDNTLEIFHALIQAGASQYITKSGCLNVSQFKAEATAPDAIGWDYLACTEIVHPIGSNNKTDMFPPSPFSVASIAPWCSQRFRVVPRPNWLPLQYGLGHISGRFSRVNTRILFAYGALDPWHTLGVGMQNLSELLPVVAIPDGSHCADMERAQSTDTSTMIAARAKEEAIITQWLQSATTNIR